MDLLYQSAATPVDETSAVLARVLILLLQANLCPDPLRSRELIASAARTVQGLTARRSDPVTEGAAAEAFARLTLRQRQIMALVLDGHPSKNIAADLKISQRTVENHRAAIMQRTGATSLPALARMVAGSARRADCRLAPAVQP